MAYSRQTWEDFVTLIDAEKMTHIEDGIVQNESDIANVSNSLAEFTNGSNGLALLSASGSIFDYVNENCSAVGAYYLMAVSESCTDLPESANFGIFMIRRSSVQAIMFAFRFGSTHKTYQCNEQSSSWGEWSQII